MSVVEVGEVTIRQVKCDLLARSDGLWVISLDARTLGRSEDYKSAKEQAARTLRRMEATVAVPFRFRDGTRAVGDRISIKTNQALAMREDGTRTELSYYRTGNPATFKPDTPGQIFKRLDAIDVEEAALHREQQFLAEEWGFDVAREVRRLIDAAAEVWSESKGLPEGGE